MILYSLSLFIKTVYMRGMVIIIDITRYISVFFIVVAVTSKSDFA